MKQKKQGRKYFILLFLLLGLYIWSAIHPYQRALWFFETLPAVIGIIILCWTYRRFPFTLITYWIIFAGVVMMFVGGHYSYGEVPLFDYLKDEFHLARNHADRFGHGIKGAIITFMSREIFIRRKLVRKGATIFALVFCLAFSGGYELVEFFSGLITKTNMEEFLGFQGDQWDTQWDIIVAVIGGIISLLLFKRIQDNQIKSMIE